MINIKKIMTIVITVLVATFISYSCYAHSPAGNDNKTETSPEKKEGVIIKRWLLLGPIEVPTPAFQEEEKRKYGPEQLLSFKHLLSYTERPAEGIKVNLINKGETAWKTARGDSGGIVLKADGDFPRIAYLSTYMELPRWTEVTVEADCSTPVEIKIDGQSVVKSTRENPSKKAKKISGESKLKRGKHLLMVKTVKTPSDTSNSWRVKVKLSSRHTDHPPELSLDPTSSLNISHILDTPSVRTIKISPDGKYIALSISKKSPPEGDTERWIEIRSSRDGKLHRTIRDIESYSNLQWAPRGNRLSYITREKDKGTIRILDLDTGGSESVVQDIENLSSYNWSPESSFIIYSVTAKPEENKTGVKRLRGIYDRTDYARRRSELFIVSVPGGVRRKLVSGKHSTHTADIHPSGNSVLITRNYEDLLERPYSISEMILLDLNTHNSQILWKGHWLRGASWSPSGEEILVSAGPSSFGEKGVNISEEPIPNEYDTQLYIFDPDTREVRPLTRKFSPAVHRAVWNRADGNIYAVAEHTSFVNLYRIDPGGKGIELIDIHADVISGGDISLSKRLAVLEAVSADQPACIYRVDLRDDKSRIIFKPAEKSFQYIELGKIEDYHFHSSGGDIIRGRIHYPPHFDQSKKYPCIVYYYGGTSPVNRSFGGRYPKNLWASMGYVIYVLQPSGATGFGQDFSARHVNDWGKRVSDEIIEGVKKFLDDHPFVDPEGVGCIGASFGGFMTQLLVTKTDIFAAAVSHAGISSISSYWGEGYWGYAYNAVSAANSFPWNSPDIYIKQSPLFSADKIHTPLLLLHGTSDTNVPPGESEQMYTALKILGRKVEYIRFAGQNHFIIDYKQRIKWSDSQLAWFDKWLKNQPEWWNDMYPPLQNDREEEPQTPEETGVEPEDVQVEVKGVGTILLGKSSRDKIEQLFPTWIDEYYNYQPNELTVGNIASLLHNVRITCIFGTWCIDSKRELPRMWKILEMAGYPISDMEMLAVGSSRFTREMGIDPQLISWSEKIKEQYGVERVATFIIHRKEKELGRIVERPRQSLEEDLLEILRRDNP